MTHFEETPIFIAFSGLHGQKHPISALDPQLQALAEETHFEEASHDIYMLDNDTDDLPGKLDVYMKRAASLFFEREISEIMRPTLLLADELSKQKKVAFVPWFRPCWFFACLLLC